MNDPSAARSDGIDADEALPEVDASGLACPMPVVELAKAINDIAVGRRLVLLSTDPTSAVDVPVWCRMQRHRLIAATEDGTAGVRRFVVERLH